MTRLSLPNRRAHEVISFDFWSQRFHVWSRARNPKCAHCGSLDQYKQERNAK